MLKTAIIKAMEERPELFKQIIKEVFLEEKSTKNEEEAQLEELDGIINKDFKRFDKVFRALA